MDGIVVRLRSTSAKQNVTSGQEVGLPLFPLPFENVAKQHMCALGERQSGWCQFDGTLEQYVRGE